MRHIQGHSRDQITLCPESLDEYITDDNPVRFLDAFVSATDLQNLGFKRAAPEETGRPPCDPADLLKLYLYGYLNRIRSSRHQCTSSKDGCRITRWADEDLLDEMERRVRASPEKMKLRKRLSEHPLGTIKRP